MHELTGPRNLCSRAGSGTSRTAPPTAGHAGTCSAQTRFGPWLVTAIQPHPSHTTSINGAPLERRRTIHHRPQSTRLPRNCVLFAANGYCGRSDPGRRALGPHEVAASWPPRRTRPYDPGPGPLCSCQSAAEAPSTFANRDARPASTVSLAGTQRAAEVGECRHPSTCADASTCVQMNSPSRRQLRRAGKTIVRQRWPPS